MLTYAHVCGRMLTYAHVCGRMVQVSVDESCYVDFLKCLGLYVQDVLTGTQFTCTIRPHT
jgi:hypothetical protein